MKADSGTTLFELVSWPSLDSVVIRELSEDMCRRTGLWIKGCKCFVCLVHFVNREMECLMRGRLEINDDERKGNAEVFAGNGRT